MADSKHTGPPLLVPQGLVVYRRWQLYNGTLYPCNINRESPCWAPSTQPNTATCSLRPDERVPHERCGCGFYAYYSPHHRPFGLSTRSVFGVMEARGRVLMGTNGVRAAQGTPRAIVWPRLWRRVMEMESTLVSASDIRRLRLRYPHLKVYRSERRMLAEWPQPDVKELLGQDPVVLPRGARAHHIVVLAGMVTVLSLLSILLQFWVAGRFGWNGTISVIALAASMAGSHVLGGVAGRWYGRLRGGNAPLWRGWRPK